MKALSLRQPWAWAVVHGGKTIENRYWNTRFRGTFLIHAAKGMTRSEYECGRAWCEQIWTDDVANRLPTHDQIERGGIVGIADLVSVVLPKDIAALQLTGYRIPSGHDPRWHMTDQHGFVLDRVRPLPFVPLKGSLSFFDVLTDAPPLATLFDAGDLR